MAGAFVLSRQAAVKSARSGREQR